MEDNNHHTKDVLARSQSWAVIRHVERLGTERKGSVFDEDHGDSMAVPIQEAQSYKPPDKTTEVAVVRRLMETLTEQQQPSTATRHSAASLKVHFRCSLDDISNDNDDDDNLSLNDGAVDCSYRSHSEATSWSVTESDLTGQGVDEDEDDVNLAPDGGWGWVIVAASFVIHLIADGITFSFGVIYAELLDYFQESKGYTAVIGSLFMATPLLSGPLASSLTDRFGCRTVTIAGSIVASLGLFLTSLSNSVEALFLTFGLIAGLGLSLCYVAAIAVVAFYFDKRLSIATGLAVCGSGIGTFIFAPVTQYLIKEYGWRGAMLILSGLFLNISVCGALMRPIEGTTTINRRGNAKGKISRSTSAEQTSTGLRSRNCSESEGEHQRLSSDSPAVLMEIKAAADSTFLEIERETVDDTRLCNSLVNLPTFLRNGDKIPHEVLMTITNNPRLYGIVLANYPTLFDGYVVSEDKDGGGSILTVEDPPKTFKDPVTSKDAAALLTIKETHPHGHPWHAAYLNGLRVKKRSLTYRGAMLNLPRYRLRASSCPDIYRNSITTIAREKEGACWDYLEELREVFMFDFSYLSNPSFVMFAISNALLYCCYHVPYIYLTDWAKTQGQSKDDELMEEFLNHAPSGGRQPEEPSFLLSIVGILNTLGVIIMGYLGDRSWANPTWIYSASMLLCGLSTAIVPLLPGSPWLEVAAGLFGLSIAANYSLVSAILVELISLERFVNAYGLLLLFQGVANLVGPPLAGYISDLTGSYDLSFYIAGIFIIFSGAILVLLPAFKHVKSRMSATNGRDSLETGMLAKEENQQQQGRTTFVRAKESTRFGQSEKATSSTPI